MMQNSEYLTNGIRIKDLAAIINKSYKQTAKIVKQAETSYGKPFERDAGQVIIPFSVAEKLKKSTQLVTREKPGSQMKALEKVDSLEKRQSLLEEPVSLQLTVEDFLKSVESLNKFISANTSRSDFEQIFGLLKGLTSSLAEMTARPAALMEHLDEQPLTLTEQRILLQATRDLASACALATQIGVVLETFAFEWEGRQDRHYREYQRLQEQWRQKILGVPPRVDNPLPSRRGSKKSAPEVSREQVPPPLLVAFTSHEDITERKALPAPIDATPLFEQADPKALSQVEPAGEPRNAEVLRVTQDELPQPSPPREVDTMPDDIWDNDPY